MPRILSALLVCAAFLACGQGYAQSELPEAPAPADGVQQVQTTGSGLPVSDTSGTGSVKGTVLDTDGAEIANVRITISATGTSYTRTLVSGGDGAFLLEGVPAGPVTLTFAFEGFDPVTKQAVLAPGQVLMVDGIIMTAGMHDEVRVVLSEHDLAAAEVKNEEQQRLVGFYPNFYVTYDWNAAPLNAKQKFDLAWKSTYDPANFVITGAVAGFQLLAQSFDWELGASGYGKRFAANFGTGLFGTFLGGAVFPALLHQDPRYIYMGAERGSNRKRALYALAAGVICRGDNGKWQPNYSSLLGNLAAGGIANAFYPAPDRAGASLTIVSALIGIGAQGASGLLEEFVFKHLTPHAETYHLESAVPPAAISH